VRRARRRSSGQVLVEFALIFPMLLVVIFGTIELALILSSLGGFNFAARDGARLGSLLGRSNPQADQDIVTLVDSHVQGLVMAKGLEVDIFRAASDGNCLNLPSGGGAEVSVDDPSCAKNRFNMDGSLYLGSSIQWPVSARNDTLANADYLGVRILFRYTFITSFLNYYCNPPSSCTTGNAGTHLDLSATSVQRIEPLDFTHRQLPTSPLVISSPGGASGGSPMTALAHPSAWWSRDAREGGL
jgi:hypothetical protein